MGELTELASGKLWSWEWQNSGDDELLVWMDEMVNVRRNRFHEHESTQLKGLLNSEAY